MAKDNSAKSKDKWHKKLRKSFSKGKKSSIPDNKQFLMKMKELNKKIEESGVKKKKSLEKKSSSKKKTSAVKKLSKSKKGGFEMDKLSRKEFLKQAGIAGAALTAMAAMGGKGMAGVTGRAAGEQSNVALFIGRDANLLRLGVITKENLPNTTITFAGTSYVLYSRIRTVLNNGMQFSASGLFKVENVLYMYYSIHPMERLAWFAKLGPEGIEAEKSETTVTPREFSEGYYPGGFKIAASGINDDNIYTLWGQADYHKWYDQARILDPGSTIPAP
ncbi:hypothetical protein KY339_06130 [Candidatus Woesearchaeota archaeon]|nr:hypothetical protein [Candidatus Woesearchaeota archaeon]